MPALAIENPGVPLVSSFNVLLDELLNEAAEAKPAPTIEPSLKKSSFNDISGRISSCLASHATTDRGRTAAQSTASRDAAKSQQFAFIETAARHLFGQLIVSVSGSAHTLAISHVSLRRPRLRSNHQIL